MFKSVYVRKKVESAFIELAVILTVALVLSLLFLNDILLSSGLGILLMISFGLVAWVKGTGNSGKDGRYKDDFSFAK